MKFKFLLVSACLFLSSTAFAELSAKSTQRIKQGIVRCDEVHNELIYKEYWRDSVKPENLKAVCMAEQFADQVATDGDLWLEQKAIGLINECRAQSSGRSSYLTCLKTPLDQAAEELAHPCVELGAEKLWGEDKCRRLVSYIFMKKFETILESYQPPVGEVKPPVDMVKPELSLTSTWRIEQAIARCDQTHNELMYKEYWKDFVKPENRKTVCMAEQFADQVAADGDHWLAKRGEELIEQCQEKGREDKKIYFLCLKKNLEQAVKMLSPPCKELGEKKLWSQQKCEHLVSYIFMKKFDQVLESRKSLWERFKLALDSLNQMTLVKFFINPVIAILVFIFFVLDVVFLMEKGTWMQVTKTGLFMGPLLLLSSFAHDGIRTLLSGIVIVIMLFIIGWNHRRAVLKPKKKKPTPIEF